MPLCAWTEKRSNSEEGAPTGVGCKHEELPEESPDVPGVP